jgi:hypothetical protein
LGFELGVGDSGRRSEIAEGLITEAVYAETVRIPMAGRMDSYGKMSGGEYSGAASVNVKLNCMCGEFLSILVPR